jgi:hypothetical protein
MFLQDFRGVVVANAHQDLRDLAGPTVFVSRFSYADGVLDGLWHWLSDNLEAWFVRRDAPEGGGQGSSGQSSSSAHFARAALPLAQRDDGLGKCCSARGAGGRWAGIGLAALTRPFRPW